MKKLLLASAVVSLAASWLTLRAQDRRVRAEADAWAAADAAAQPRG